MAKKSLDEDLLQREAATGKIQTYRLNVLRSLALLAIFSLYASKLFRYGEISSFVTRIYSQTRGGDNRIGTVNWYKCGTQPGFECGSIVVPLDYFNTSKGTSTIALGRYKATKFPKKGTILLNPGGPGGSGVRLANPLVAETITGPYYDLVGFDPRGVGNTIPRVECFPSQLGRQIFRANTVLEQGFTVSSNLTDPRTREHLVEQQREFLAMKKTQADLCAQNVGDNLRYMGTVTVVRDMDFMTRAFEGDDALINYWGGSYGTILGAYLVNMLPDRIGRVAIDGVANPIIWSSKPSQYWHRDFISSIDDTYQIFLNACSEAGPTMCPLAHYAGERTNKIERRIDSFLDELYTNPLPVPNARRPGFLTAGGVRALLLIFMQAPRAWPMGATWLAEAMAGNGTNILNMLLPSYSPNTEPDLSAAADLSRLAVTCLDSPPPADKSEFPTPEDLADIGLGTIRDVSRRFGMSVSISEPDGGCQFWPVTGPERFTGPWNHTLRNPILIADPVTPIASGRLLNNLLFNSSRLLIQNSPGHGSLALSSLCTTKAYLAFFTNGTLPPNEFVCEVEEQPFPKSNAFSDAMHLMSVEDAKMALATQELGEMMTKIKIEGIFNI